MSVAAVLLASAAPSSQAAFILQAKTSFGGGDGWLAPAEATHLQGASLQRGITYNPANNHVYVVDRNGGNFIRILDGSSGALLGSLDMTGITGGTFAVNMIDVDDQGIIYAANLSGDTDVSPFKVYRWATEASAPTVAFNSTATPIASGADIRVGDAFAVIGSGANTRMVAGANVVAGGAIEPGDNAFVLLTTADGAAYSGAVQDFVGTEPATGALRLGVDFIDVDTIIGRQASTPPNGIVADFAANVATQVALAELTQQFEAPLAVDRINNLLATVQTTTSAVRLYDITNPDVPVLLDTKNLIVGASVANGNGAGDLKFANGMLYVLNTNNGIQAFNVVVPEPATIGLFAAMAGVLAINRRRMREI
jgi:hypothetical protein